MKLKKVLTSLSLAIALLISTVPAVSASATGPINKAAVCEKQTIKVGVYPSRNDIPATKKINGTTWYLKGAEVWKGEWSGLYEGWVCG